MNKSNLKNEIYTFILSLFPCSPLTRGFCDCGPVVFHSQVVSCIQSRFSCPFPHLWVCCSDLKCWCSIFIENFIYAYNAFWLIGSWSLRPIPLPNSPTNLTTAFFFKKKKITYWVQFVLPIQEWLWGRLLVHSQPPWGHSHEENNFFPSKDERLLSCCYVDTVSKRLSTTEERSLGPQGSISEQRPGEGDG